MFDSGSSLRGLRQSKGLSQAKLAEAAGIPQHILSSFELGNTDLQPGMQQRIEATLYDEMRTRDLSGRKKRYREHAYSRRQHDPDRVAQHVRAAGNPDYLNSIAALAHVPPPSFTGLSLFSGCGGFSLGFRAAGCDIKGYIEIDDALSRIYSENFARTERLGGCIQSVNDTLLSDFIGRSGPIDVLLGGPPCQGFSLAGKRDVADVRNELFRDYMRIVEAVKPKVAILENVRLLTSMKSKQGRYIKDEISNSFREKGYSVALYEVNAADYGVPQDRNRVIFIAVDRAMSISPSMPKPSHSDRPSLFVGQASPRTFADACSDLTFLEAGESDPIDDLHAAVTHPDHVVEWLWDVPQGKSAHDNADPALRPPSGYNTTYKRQVWTEPGATVQTTFGMISGCRTVHPIATRSLTAREAARLQSFPDSYRFTGSLGAVRTGIGNAVPPFWQRR